MKTASGGRHRLPGNLSRIKGRTCGVSSSFTTHSAKAGIKKARQEPRPPGPPIQSSKCERQRVRGYESGGKLTKIKLVRRGMYSHTLYHSDSHTVSLLRVRTTGR